MKQPRGTQRYRSTQPEDEDRLTHAIAPLASQYGRDRYRRVIAQLRHKAGMAARTGSRDSGVVRAEGSLHFKRIKVTLAEQSDTVFSLHLIGPS